MVLFNFNNWKSPGFWLPSSTKHPKALGLINEVVSFIFIMCKEIPPLILVEEGRWIQGWTLKKHLSICICSVSSAPTTIVMLYMLPLRWIGAQQKKVLLFLWTSIKYLLICWRFQWFNFSASHLQDFWIMWTISFVSYVLLPVEFPRVPY